MPSFWHAFIRPSDDIAGDATVKAYGVAGDLRPDDENPLGLLLSRLLPRYSNNLR